MKRKKVDPKLNGLLTSHEFSQTIKTPTHRVTCVGQSAKFYVHPLYADKIRSLQIQ